ncbi:hypothetical protein PO909_008514 [Leuciscus waleckii]
MCKGSASPPAPPDVYSSPSSPGSPCDVEPPASLLFAPCQLRLGSSRLSSITPAPPQPSGTLASPLTLFAVASLRSPVPAMSLISIGSPSVPVDPSASSTSVVPQLLSTFTPSWLLRPSTPPWTVSTGELWVCAIVLFPSSPPGDSRNPHVIPPLSSSPVTTPSPPPCPPPNPPQSLPLPSFCYAASTSTGNTGISVAKTTVDKLLKGYDIRLRPDFGEAGRAGQPNVERITVSSIIQTFLRQNRTEQNSSPLTFYSIQ